MKSLLVCSLLLFFSEFGFSQKGINKDSLWTQSNNIKLPTQQRIAAASKLAKLVLTDTGSIDLSQKVSNLLINIGRKLQIDSLRYQGYLGLSYSYAMARKLNLMFPYTDSVIPYLIQQNEYQYLAYLHTQRGERLYEMGRHNMAIAENKKAMNCGIQESHVDTSGLFLNASNIAMSFSELGVLDSAFYYLKLAHGYATKSNNFKLRYKINLQMGLYYYYQNVPKKMFPYLNKVLEVKDRIQDYDDLYDLYTMLGKHASLVNRDLEAVAYCKKAKEYAVLAKNQQSEQSSNDDIGRYYMYVQQLGGAKAYLDSAEVYLELAYNYAITNKDYRMIAPFATSLSDYYNYTKQFQKAVDIARIAMKYYTSELDIYNSYECLYTGYKGLKDFEHALIYLEKYKQLHDSLFNQVDYQKLVELEEEQKFNLKKQQLEAKKALAEKEAELTRLISFGALGFAILLLAIVTIVYKNLDKTKKQKTIIEAANQQKELLLKEIHHRVKNNLQLVISLLNLQSRQLDDGKLKNVFEDSKTRIEAMALLHKKLYQSEDLSVVNFNAYLTDLIEIFGNIDTPHQKVKITTNIPDTFLDIDTAVPLGLLSSELITNSFKYAFKDHPNPELNISLVKNDTGTYVLTHTDNGPGLPSDFDWGRTKSLGLRLIKGLSKQLSGTVDYKYTQGLSVFTVTFTDLSAQV